MRFSDVTLRDPASGQERTYLVARGALEDMIAAARLYLPGDPRGTGSPAKRWEFVALSRPGTRA